MWAVNVSYDDVTVEGFFLGKIFTQSKTVLLVETLRFQNAPTGFF